MRHRRRRGRLRFESEEQSKEESRRGSWIKKGRRNRHAQRGQEAKCEERERASRDGRDVQSFMPLWALRVRRRWVFLLPREVREADLQGGRRGICEERMAVGGAFGDGQTLGRRCV